MARICTTGTAPTQFGPIATRTNGSAVSAIPTPSGNASMTITASPSRKVRRIASGSLSSAESPGNIARPIGTTSSDVAIAEISRPTEYKPTDAELRILPMTNA